MGAAGTVANSGALSIQVGSAWVTGTIYVDVGNGALGYAPGLATGTWSATRTSHGSPYQGMWVINVAGPYTGQCPTMGITMAGVISGVCSLSAGTLGTTGTVTDSGVVNILAGISPGYFTLVGNMVTTMTGSGTWTYGVYAGTWTATKQ